MKRIRIALLLPALAAVLLPACQEITYKTEQPCTWQFEMRDPIFTSRTYDLSLLVTVNGPKEYYIRLYAPYNQASLAACQDWAWELNRKQKGMAETDRNKLIIHGVLDIEFQGSGKQAFKITNLGPTP